MKIEHLIFVIGLIVHVPRAFNHSNHLWNSRALLHRLQYIGFQIFVEQPKNIKFDSILLRTKFLDTKLFTLFFAQNFCLTCQNTFETACEVVCKVQDSSLDKFLALPSVNGSAYQKQPLDRLQLYGIEEGWENGIKRYLPELINIRVKIVVWRCRIGEFSGRNFS